MNVSVTWNNTIAKPSRNMLMGTFNTLAMHVDSRSYYAIYRNVHTFGKMMNKAIKFLIFEIL